MPTTITVTAQDPDARAAYRALIARLMTPACEPHIGWQNAQQLEMSDEHVAIVLRAMPELFPNGLKLEPAAIAEVVAAFEHSDFIETDRKLGIVFGALMREAARAHLFSDLQEACWERDDRAFEASRTVATQAFIDRAYADAVGVAAVGEL